ncbi:MAG: DegT/DnrJ/EryC1/StrS family aminotransferase [Lachnospiraceae bacterium]|nr:DegT/DnrJ/EryC1/StrS family aminotransferase [Lachnospiraceae bacterium]MCI9362551.1 DegT/DnrJ/EryC1/StrS family aminotransferase [Hungatella sp.]
MSELEISEVIEVLQSGWITTGPRTKKLETLLADYMGTPKVVCLNSATAAEELILRILGIGEGDEVIVPAYTYTSTAAAALHVGAKVIFIDSQTDCMEMDYDAVERAINEHTKAIIPVDLGGVVCDYERIFELAERKRDCFVPGGNNNIGEKIQNAIGRVIVIADCAHALGAQKKINNSWYMAGNIADFSTFSFHAVKNFTTAEGGAATWREIADVDSDEIYRFFQLYSLHGQNKDALAKTQLGSWEYDIIGPWYKCNMTDIMAGIGLKQLERYPDLLKRREEIISRYDKACDELGIEHLVHYTDNMVSSGHLYITRIPGANDFDRRKIITSMAERGIVCNVHYKPLPLMSGYQALGVDKTKYSNAVRLYQNEVTLPLHTLLTDEDVSYVTEQFADVVKNILNYK